MLEENVAQLGHSDIAFSITNSQFDSDTALITMGRPFYN